jgi:UDP-N-acetylmuramoyl-L-alanyl-D-glutamate--2,6-diaminopimelate ligase
MLLSTLLTGFAPRPALPEGFRVTGLQSDSRKVQAGDVFLAAQGVGSHGLQYVEVALDNGAAAVLWEPASGISEPFLDVPTVAVPNLSGQMGALAARFYGEPAKALKSLGVTGTDGKTSTAWLSAQLLSIVGEPASYIGTLGLGAWNNLAAASYTTPFPLELHSTLAGFVAQGHKALCMEVSSHALDQGRVAGVRFDAAILTNITRDHLDYHGTVEAYAAAKKKLFTTYASGACVLNTDDPHGLMWAKELPHVIAYGLQPQAGFERYLWAENLRLSTRGLSFILNSAWGSVAVQSKLLGRFNVSNLLAVLGGLLALGYDFHALTNAIPQLVTVPGRMEALGGGEQPLVVVDYAHTPKALEGVLTALRAHTSGKLICVFGCGGDRDRGKRPLMGLAAQRLADVVIITDDNPRSEDPASIVAEIGSVGTVIHDRAHAIQQAISQAKMGDVVLIAGKGHENTQTYGHEVRGFSDKAEVLKGLQQG